MSQCIKHLSQKYGEKTYHNKLNAILNFKQVQDSLRNTLSQEMDETATSRLKIVGKKTEPPGIFHLKPRYQEHYPKLTQAFT